MGPFLLRSETDDNQATALTDVNDHGNISGQRLNRLIACSTSEAGDGLAAMQRIVVRRNRPNKLKIFTNLSSSLSMCWTIRII